LRLPFAVKVQNSSAVKVYDSKGEVCERGGSTKDKFLNLYGRRGKFVLCEVFYFMVAYGACSFLLSAWLNWAKYTAARAHHTKQHIMPGCCARNNAPLWQKNNKASYMGEK
jgi:hypothetical protein